MTSPTALPELSAWLLIELGLVDGLSPGSIAVANGAMHGEALASRKQLERTRQRVLAHGKVTAQEVSSEPCSGGGTSEINDDGLRDDGTGVVIFRFRDCVEGGERLNGVVRTTIATYSVAIDMPTDYTVSYEGLVLSSGSASIEAGGTQHVVFSQVPGINITTTTSNTVARYSPQNVYTRLQNFTSVERVRPLYLGEPADLTFSGRFYQSVHGYVDVQTAATVQVPEQQRAVAGELRLTSSGNARVFVRFDEGQSTLSIGMDSDGDGMIERGLSGSLQQLLSPGGSSNYPPFANAGPDVTIDEGQSVTLDGSLSRDWEQGALSYAWSVTVPIGAAPVSPATGPSFTFTPSEGGEYLVHLAVGDGQSLGHDLVRVNVRDNFAPRAEAGIDTWVLEGGSVRLNAGASSDYEGDELQFTWTLLQAPTGSAAPARLVGVTADVVANVPGAYVYELRVSDANGSSTDVTTIHAEAVLTNAYVNSFQVIGITRPEETVRQVQLQVSPRYTGPPIALTITSDTPWIRVDTPNVTTAQTVSLSLDLPRLANVPNGTSMAHVRIAPANFTPRDLSIELFMHLPILEQVSPYVVYAGQSTGVALYGYGMDSAYGRSLEVGGIEVSGFTDLMLVSGRITLPALAAGEYEVRVRNQLGIQFPPARLLVRDAPTYINEDLALPGAVRALEYDTQRDVFYAVFDVDTGTIARRLQRQPDGSWRNDPIDVSNPRSLTLTVDGTQLLVTSANCGVHEINIDTLAVVESTTKGNCVAEDFGIIHGLASRQVIVADSDQWSSVWTYPGFAQIPYLPSVHSATTVLSYDRSRMLWAEQPSISPPRELYSFDTYMRQNAVFVSAVDANTSFSRSNLAISGDGSYAMHREHVYDGTESDGFWYVGSLPGVSGPNLMPALSHNGSRAVVLDPATDTLSLFEIPGRTLIQDIDTFSADVLGGRMMFMPDDSTVIAFTQTSAGYRLFVRRLP